MTGESLFGVVNINVTSDSKIVKTYSCDKSKVSCILNYPFAPDLQAIYIDRSNEKFLFSIKV